MCKKHSRTHHISPSLARTQSHSLRLTHSLSLSLLLLSTTHTHMNSHRAAFANSTFTKSAQLKNSHPSQSLSVPSGCVCVCVRVQERLFPWETEYVWKEKERAREKENFCESVVCRAGFLFDAKNGGEPSPVCLKRTRGRRQRERERVCVCGWEREREFANFFIPLSLPSYPFVDSQTLGFCVLLLFYWEIVGGSLPPPFAPLTLPHYNILKHKS